MSKRHWRLRIEDVLECIERINQYTENMEMADFEKSSMTIDAVVRNLEIIGEASRHIPDEIREKYPEIDWKNVIGLRNRVIHEYFGVDLNIIWHIIKQELPALKESMAEILEKEN